ncbi:glycosyltransferase family 2 protein [Candidatus Parcubacteria bacterium]|nr:glycosyltransferase family 2 protein [Candidatus Parcubacteria bacterium]
MPKIITVIICTYNRSKYLKLCLQSLIEQTLSQNYFDIIVIDNNSNDDTKKITDKFLNILPFKYVFEKNQGLSYARNRGIKESNTEYIAYIDDDAKANKNWLQTAYKIIQEKNPAIFGGPIYPYYESKKPKWFLDKYETRKISEKGKYLTKNEFLSGSNIFFKKNIFNKIGLFDNNLGMKGGKISIGEETKIQIIANKKEKKKYYEPTLFVYHLVPKSKMTIKYRIKRYFISCSMSKSIFYNQKQSLTMDCYRFTLAFINFFKCPFRDRKKYPYWQNYFIEMILPNISIIGRTYSCFKK